MATVLDSNQKTQLSNFANIFIDIGTNLKKCDTKEEAIKHTAKFLDTLEALDGISHEKFPDIQEILKS